MSDDKNPPSGPSAKSGEGSPGEGHENQPGGRTTHESPTSGEGEEKTYDEKYVQNLRDEAAAHRVKAKRAESAETRLRDAAIREHAAGLLTDPSDLAWSEDLVDDDGWPDPEKIKAAAEELLKRKPHLGRPAGDVGQGRHDEKDDSVSLAAMLRAGA